MQPTGAEMRGKTTVAPDARGARGDPAGSGGPPPPIIGKEFPEYRYGTLIARYPALTLAVSSFLPLIFTVIALGLQTRVQVRTDSFVAEDTNAYQNLKDVEAIETYWESQIRQQENTPFASLDTTRTRYKPTYRITLHFVLNCRSADASSVSCENMLVGENIAAVKAIEDAATSSSIGFNRVCWENNFADGVAQPFASGCAPVNSLTQYFFPSQVTFAPFYTYDGKGSTQMRFTQDMHTRMLQNPYLSWYGDSDLRYLRRTKALRTQIVLGTPISSQFTESQTRDLIDEYIVKMYDAVYDVADQYPRIDVSIGGDRVVEARIIDLLRSEAWKAPVACVVIFVVCYLHGRSIVISALGTIQVLFTYLCSIAIFGMSRGGDLPMLSFVSLFFTVVWTVDGVLVVYDNFIHSGIIPTSGRRNTLRVGQRISFVFRKSIKGLLIAHACACGAFGANTMSPIRELRDFATLMLIMTLVSAYFFIFYTPSMILFHHFYFSRRRRTLQRQKEIMMANGMLRRNPHMTALLDELEGLKSVTGQTPYEEIAEEAARRKAANKKQRKDLMAKTSTLINGFSTEWNVKFRMISERSEVRRQNADDAAREEQELDGQFSASPPQRIGPNADPDGFSPRHDDAATHSGSDDGGEAAQVVRIESRAYGDDGQQATLDDFADVDESAAAGEGGAPVDSSTFYRSMRHIPNASVTHIPPQLLYRNPENVDFARRLASTKLPQAAAAAAPANRRSHHHHGADLEDTVPAGSSVAAAAHRAQQHAPPDDVDELVLDDEGHVQSADAMRQTAPPCLQFPVLTENGTDEYPSRADPLFRLENLVLPFNSTWSTIADELEIFPGNSPMAEITGILAHRVVSHLLGPAVARDNTLTRFDSSAQAGARLARGGWVDIDGRFQHMGTGNDEAEAVDDTFEVGWGPCRKTTNVRRKWCCGRWGTRVNESREERDARIMKKKVKHEGYGRMERFFHNTWSTMIHRSRRVIAFLSLVALGLSIWGITTIKAMDSRVRLFVDDSNEARFDTHQGLFPLEQAECDFCGAAYRDPREFRPLTQAIVSACTSQGFSNEAPNGLLDQCGRCFGSNDCYDCRGVPNGGYTLDDCGVCVAQNASTRNVCNTCDANPAIGLPACQLCALTQNLSAGGPGCTRLCDEDNCPSDRGSCNPFTGRCDCHQSTTLGFFATAAGESIQCTRCASGFEPTPTRISGRACHRDCTFGSGSTPEACGSCGLDGRCPNCPTGMRGSDCATKDPDVCVFGNVNTDGVCECYAGYSGARCAGEEVCNGRGLWLSAADTSFGAVHCDCIGMWSGPKCEVCRCRNGGTCGANGQCVCPAGWSGARCESCDGDCSRHGTCPTPMLPGEYEPADCIGAFCSLDELLRGVVCDVCVRTTVGPCLSYLPPFNIAPRATRIELCDRDSRCFYNLTADGCFESKTTNRTVETRVCSNCKGYWTGDGCNVCNNPEFTTGCDDNGETIGCDGFRYAPGSLIPQTDLCGVCGGTNRCVGCDGAIATNGAPKVLDACGVCGGDGNCETESSPFVVKMMLGITTKRFASDPLATPDYAVGFRDDFDWTTIEAQSSLANMCENIVDQVTGPNTVSELLSCPMYDMREWLRNPLNNRELGRIDNAAGFPIAEGNASYRRQIFWKYLERTSGTKGFGFTNANPTSSDFQGAFQTIRMRSLAAHDGDPSRLFYLATRFDALAASASRLTGLFAIQVSERWVDAITEIQARTGLAWALGIGFGILLMLIHVLTCSMTCTIIALVAVGLTALASIALFAAFGWTLGAVEQIGLSLLMGMGAEHTIHMLETYLDTVQGATAHLFARDVSRQAALRLSLAQSLSSITASSVTTVAVGAIYATSPIRPFQKSSLIAITITLVSFIVSLFVVGALLVMAGPTSTYRLLPIGMTILLHWVALWGVIIFVLWIAQATAPDGSRAIG